MSLLDNFLNKPKNRRNALILALIGAITPLSGLHKFYLGQPLWGAIYLLLWATPMPRIACAIEAVWYVIQDREQFELQFNGYSTQSNSQAVSAIAQALRELDRLREDGLLSEYEFEQKRRQLLDRIA